MLEAARDGQTGSAEMATGYYWGETRLKPHVERILARAREQNDERLIQLADDFSNRESFTTRGDLAPMRAAAITRS
jgi:hypothetical protein